MSIPRRSYMFVATYLILLKNDQTLLLRRHNTGYQDGNYSLIAGHVERGERVTEALIREAFEEAGIRIEAKDLTFVHVMQRTSSDDLIYIDFFFAAKEWSGEITNQEPSKCDDLSWFPLDSLPENTIPYVRSVLLEQMKRTEYFSEFDGSTSRTPPSKYEDKILRNAV